MKLSTLFGETRPLAITFGGEALNIRYRPRAMTNRLEAELREAEESKLASEALLVMLEAMLVEWDLTDDRGRPIPTSREGLAIVPVEALVEVVNKITEEVRPNPPSESV